MLSPEEIGAERLAVIVYLGLCQLRDLGRDEAPLSAARRHLYREIDPDQGSASVESGRHPYLRRVK